MTSDQRDTSRQITDLLRDLAWIRELPEDDPDRIAWIEQKLQIIHGLEELGGGPR